MTRPMREANVDLSAITSNVRILKAAVAPAAAMVVVKANAYGHGMVPVALAAVEGGADWLGVVDITEALGLRAAGITVPILAWLHGEEADYAAAVAAGIDIGVSSLAQLEAVALAGAAAAHASPVGLAGGSTGAAARVHIKVDTGLGRNGVEESECAAVFARAAQFERDGSLLVRGIFSHLANAGEEADLDQVRRFDAQLDAAEQAGLSPEIRHLAATAGALRLPGARYNLVRFGIGVYGLSPFDDESSTDLGSTLGLRPAMELSAEITSVKSVPAGSGVSYGLTYRTTAPSTLVLVPLGYADGIPRSASSAGPVWINGARYSVAGRIAMDQFVVDVGNAPVAVGDRAVLFGRGDGAGAAIVGGADAAERSIPTADDWATAAGTINYEIVTRIGNRVTRTYTPEQHATGVSTPEPFPS